MTTMSSWTAHDWVKIKGSTDLEDHINLLKVIIHSMAEVNGRKTIVPVGDPDDMEKLTVEVKVTRSKYKGDS